jgi:lysozyme
MKISPQGMFALALHEGIVPGPYKDSVGVWTYGIGHTASAGPPNPAKMKRGMPPNLDAEIKRAVALFESDVERYASDVQRALRRPVEQHQFDAMVSFHYNTGAIARASLTKLANAGDIAGAAKAFMRWRKPSEIIPRRQAEQRLFRDGTYPSGVIPVWSVTESGRVMWRQAASVSRHEFLTMFKSVAVAEKNTDSSEKGGATDSPERFPVSNRGPFNER